MFKNIIGPIQAWLLTTGKCVGCGRLLNKAQRIETKNGTEKVVCKCGRIYIFEISSKKYRRAMPKEI